MKKLVIVFVLLGVGVMNAQDLNSVHLHNDYLISGKILVRALVNDVGRVEVDVHPFKDSLVVSHWRFNLNAKETIDELYLDRIVEHLNRNSLSDLDSGFSITLFIDIKSRSSQAIVLVRNLIDKYKPYIHNYSEDAGNINGSRPIKIFLSGKLPIGKFVDDDFDFLRLDGDFSKSYPKSLLPYIAHLSCPLRKARRLSKGNLNSLVKSAHYYNRTARFYKAKPNKEAWKKLLDLNVDYINVDDTLDEYIDFLNTYKSKK